MSRWQELKLLKPRGLEQQCARATTIESVSRYYQELGSILDKYSLKDSPERIYNVDEKGLYTSHTPPAVVTSCDLKPQAVTSGSRSLVTVIGCGNALGYSVPPFFVFPGAYHTRTSISYSSYFLHTPAMFCSHLMLDALDHLKRFTTPSATSSCVKILDKESQRVNVSSLGNTAYSKALTPSNLLSSFRKTGIYPYNPHILHSFNFKPSEVLQEDKSTDIKEKQNFAESSSFFSEKSKKITEKKAVTKKRQYLSNVVSGKAITEDSTIDRIKQHEESKKKAKV